MINNNKYSTLWVVITVLVTMVVVVSLLGIKSVKDAEQNAVHDFNKRQLLLAKEAAIGLDALFEHLVHSTRSLAQRPEIQGSDERLIRAELQYTFNQLAPSAIDVLMTDSEGIIKYDAVFPEREGSDFSQKIGYYEKTLSPNMSYLIGFNGLKEDYNKTRLFQVGVPIIIKGNSNDSIDFGGLIIAQVKLESITKKYVEYLKSSPRGHSFLINKDHLILWSSDNSFIGRDLLEESNGFPLFQEIIKNASQGGTGAAEYSFYKFDESSGKYSKEVEEKIIAYTSVKIGNEALAIGVWAPKEEVHEIIRALHFKEYFIIGLIVAAIILGFSYVLIDYSSYQKSLELEVKTSLQELQSSKQKIEEYSKKLEETIGEKTKELKEELEKESKATKAMIFVLERVKRTNVELENSKKVIERSQKNLENKNLELQRINLQLMKAEEKLSSFNAELERTVKERTKEIEDERNKVSKLLKQKTEFINQLSHDIRTPITPIITLVSILKQKLRDKEDLKRVEIIQRNAEYLNSLVEDTLKLAKLDLGRIELKIENSDLGSLINETIMLNKIVFNKKGIKPVVKLEKELYARCDKLRIREVLENIMSNSIKFTPRGGKLTFRSKKGKDNIIISITDTGIGMSKEELNHIFEEFYRADPSRHGHSYGLGLAICKSIIERHKGKIWVKSPGKGKGASFFIQLPK